MGNLAKTLTPAIALTLAFSFISPVGGAAGRPSARGVGLQTVLASGLDQPLLVTNAHDGTNRLFIVEKPGTIKVLPQSATAPTVFLDIRSKVLQSGDEQGLLGLAFHPRFASNGRFFVDYTRVPDGAVVVAEYDVSADDPDHPEPAERTLIAIDQPTSSHNGGMIAFGPDGYLYIGVGDGGGAKDPDNRAQDPQDLHGKVLRIDVDRADPDKAYASPAGNPYYGTGVGRDEVYALGFRNPWRFSFDRIGGRLYLGDVGESEVEEIDVVRAGGNYGWRVFEGTRCTNLGPAPCAAADFVPPVAEYKHEGGRCSVIGGYAYRGAGASLPFGAYAYGDTCTGEIFLFNAGAQSVIANGPRALSSFGEDESGEIYVVGLEGTIQRLVNPGAPTAPTFYIPAAGAGMPSGQARYTGIAITNTGSEGADLALTAYDSGGAMIRGEGIDNPRFLPLSSGQQVAMIDARVFGPRALSEGRIGWIKLESNHPGIAAFFLDFNPELTVLEGADAASTAPGFAVLPEVEAQGATQVRLTNPYSVPASATLRLVSADGKSLAVATRSLDANGSRAELATDLFPGAELASSDYVQVLSNQGVVSLESLSRAGSDPWNVSALDATAGTTILYSPHYVAGGNYSSSLSVVNLDSAAGSLTLQIIADNGSQLGETRNIPIAGNGKIRVEDPGFFFNAGSAPAQGYLKISGGGLRLAGSIVYSDREGESFSAALPLASEPIRNLIFSQVASNPEYFTGIAILNPGETTATIKMDVCDNKGSVLASTREVLLAHARRAGVLTELFPELAGEDLHSGYVRITSDAGLVACALFGTNSLSALSAIPASGY